MSTNYVVKGLPDGIIQRNIRDGMALRVVDNCLHTSKLEFPDTVTEDLTFTANFISTPVEG